MNTNPSSKSPVQQAQFPQSCLGNRPPSHQTLNTDKRLHPNYNHNKPITALQKIRTKNWTWAVLVSHIWADYAKSRTNKCNYCPPRKWILPSFPKLHAVDLSFTPRTARGSNSIIPLPLYQAPADVCEVCYVSPKMRESVYGRLRWEKWSVPPADVLVYQSKSRAMQHVHHSVKYRLGGKWWHFCLHLIAWNIQGN